MNTTNLILALVFSSLVTRYCGIALLIYPYLVTDTLVLVAVGIGLMLVPRFVEI